MRFAFKRVLGYLVGFLFFYEPFMLFSLLTNSFLVEMDFTSIHVPCARIPLASIFTGQWENIGPTSLLFCILLVISSLWFGPLFCGRLCPAGAFSEYLSNILPDKYKMDLNQLVAIVPLRYGFFAGYLFSMVLGLGYPCVYCNYYAFELFIGYLNTGQLLTNSLSLVLTFFVSNIILGTFTKGGRGYCNFLCPVGTFCSIFHVLGRYFPYTYCMQIKKAQCVGCGLCIKKCPMRAINIQTSKPVIDRHLCIICGQCQHFCPNKSITYSCNRKERETRLWKEER